jgi:septum formation protein
MLISCPPIILASRSPRRRQLLAAAGYEFTVQPPSEAAEGGVSSGETPVELVARLARQKAADVARHCQEGLVLGCDTLVECRGQVLGKPIDVEHARRMLQTLRGCEHHVYSGLCLWRVPGDRFAVEVARTTLEMIFLSDEQIEQYLRTGDWEGKAGAFGYQDGHDWLRILRGSESNVVGLPMELLADMIPRFHRPGMPGPSDPE